MAVKKKTSKAQENDAKNLPQTSTLEGDGGMPFVPELDSSIVEVNVSSTITDKDNMRKSENRKDKKIISDNRKKKNSPPASDWPIDRQNIKVIRERTSCFIVFLDTNENVRWLMNDSGDVPLSDDARGAISKIRLLATIPVTYFSDDQRKAWHHMIGESLALALSGDVENARLTINKTKDFVLARAKETARIWFVQGSLYAFVPTLLFGISLYFLMNHLAVDLWFHVPLAQAVVFGAIGAQFSMLLRLSNLNVDPGAGKKAHYGEAIVRILLGVFAAVIAVVAVQADLIFGFIDHLQPPQDKLLINVGAKLWWVPAIALLAGASERFIPTFLHQIETQALTNGVHATEAENNKQEMNTDKEDDNAQQTASSKEKRLEATLN